jgi:hypothetical protein
MSNIQSVLEEKRLFPPSPEFAARARLNADRLAALRAEAEKDPTGFWADLARKHIHWQTPFRAGRQDRDPLRRRQGRHAQLDLPRAARAGMQARQRPALSGCAQR